MAETFSFEEATKPSSSFSFEEAVKPPSATSKPPSAPTESAEERRMLDIMGKDIQFGKGFGSGVAQMVTGAGELLPQEYGGRTSAEATKYLKGIGDPRAQKVGELAGSILPFGAAESLASKGLTSLRGALKIPETSTLYRGVEAIVPGAFGGAVTGGIEPTGITNEQKRLQEKKTQAAIGGVTGGAVGGAAEAIPAVGRTIKAAISPEKTIAEKIATKIEGPTDIGSKIESNVLDRLKESINQRKSQAKKLFEDFYASVEPYEYQMRVQYNSRLRDYALKREGGLSEEQLKLLNDSLKRIENPSKQISGSESYANAKGLDLERRRLSDLADQPPEGYTAATIQTARDLEKIMQEVLNTPPTSNFDQVLSTYAKLSEPVNLSEIAFGQKVTKRAGDYISDLPKFDRSKLANEAFRSRDSVEAFRRLSGNNEPLVQEVARDKLALDLKGKSTSKEVRKVIDDNIDWLNTPQMKDTIYKELLELESSLKAGQRTRMGAGAVAALTLGSQIPSALNKAGSFFSGGP